MLSLLYDRSRGWPLLADALSQAANAGTAASLLAYADQWVGRAPDGHWDPKVEASTVISCVDKPDEVGTDERGRARRRRHVPVAAAAVGRFVGHRRVCGHAEAGQGRQAR